MLLSSVFKIFNYRRKEKCLSDEQIYLFAKGQSDKKIEQHIKDCPDCSETLRLIQESHSVTNAIGFKEPDLRIPELRGKLEKFLAQYAKPEPVAFQFSKTEKQFHLKEKPLGAIGTLLEELFIFPPPLKIAVAVRGEDSSAIKEERMNEHRGTIETDRYSIQISGQKEKGLIDLRIIPDPEQKELDFSKLGVKIVKADGEVLLEKSAPFDEYGKAQIELPKQLADGDYALIIE
jgi:hypothetical protein